MSKVDAQRAMREARYARFAAAKAAEDASAAGPPAKSSTRRAPAVAPVGKGLADELAASTPTPSTTEQSPTGQTLTEQAAAEQNAGEVPATEELCGHRSMNGRTCTREKDHEQKNHRYS